MLGDNDETEAVLELDTDDQDETETTEQIDEPGEPTEDDEVIGASFEDEPEADAAPPSERESTTIRALRARVKELQKTQVPAPAKIDVGKKPDLWDDCEGDPDKFEEELDAYKKRVADAKDKEVEANKAVEQNRETFATDYRIYEQQKAKLPNIEVAEAAIESALSQDQQSILLMAAKQKGALIDALGKHPKKLAELAKITHVVKLAVAIADMERGLKMKIVRKGIEPEEKMRGTANMAPDQKTAKKNAILDKMAKGGDVTELRKQLKALDA